MKKLMTVVLAMLFAASTGVVFAQADKDKGEGKAAKAEAKKDDAKKDAKGDKKDDAKKDVKGDKKGK